MRERINNSDFLNFSERQIYNYTFIFLIILAIALRLLGINKGIWIDDYASIHMFSQSTLEQTLQELRTDTHPPLYFIILHFWSQINDSEAWMRLPSIFANIATVYISIKWLKNYSYLAATLGGLYFTTSPILLRYSHEIRGYSLLVLATVLAFFFASQLLIKPEKKSGYWGLTLSLSMAVSTHMIGVMLIIPICLLIVLLSIVDQQKISGHKLLISILIPSLLFLFFYWFYLDGSAASKISWLPPISPTLISYITNFTFGGYTTLYYPTRFDSLITLMIFGSIGYLIFVGKNPKAFVFLICALIYWLEIIIYSILNLEIYWFTSSLPILVPVIAFATLEISSIAKSSLKRFWVLGFILLNFFFAITWSIDEAWKPLEEYQKVSQLLQQNWQKNSALAIYPHYIESTIKYYWKELPLKSTLTFKTGTNIEELKSQVKKIHTSKTLFLVVRLDLGISEDLANFDQKLSLIASKIENPFEIEELIIISNGFLKIDPKKEVLAELLARQQSIFGQILSYNDFGSYIVVNYNSKLKSPKD